MLPTPVRGEFNAGYEPFKVSFRYYFGNRFFFSGKFNSTCRIFTDYSITGKEVKEALQYSDPCADRYTGQFTLLFDFVNILPDPGNSNIGNLFNIVFEEIQ